MASKVGPETPSSEHLGGLFGFLGRPWEHFSGPGAFQSPFETHSKKYQNFGDFRVPPGTATEYRRPGSPPSRKRTFSAKVAISLQRGANFQFLDFGTPLEKSIPLTFSEQWLCHFSKGAFRWGVPVGRPCKRKPHANFVHEGTVADKASNMV